MLAEKTVLLPVSADDAFALITEPDRLRRWKTVSARVDLRAGGEYRWTVVPGHVAAGTFIEVEPGQRIVFGWGWEGSPDLGPDASTVTITLQPAEGGTLVSLVHEGLTEQQVVSHLEGWNHFFTRLERVASTGDAGPDEWASVPADLNPLTCAEATLAVCQNVLRGISEGDLDKPTPCSEFTVGQLADHLIGSMVSLGGMAGAVVTPADPGTIESRVAFVAQQTLEAWDERGLEGTVKRGERDLPAALAASIVSVELLVHGWDFAVATAQQVCVSDQVSSYVLELARTLISPQSRRGGSFADAVEVGPDTDILDRLIAFSGRTAA
ncbi:MAG TPA: TIGR03086 family metal-binding protein [Dermatophilaceae bacterium]